jgi:hypothetical protein
MTILATIFRWLHRITNDPPWSIRTASINRATPDEFAHACVFQIDADGSTWPVPKQACRISKGVGPAESIGQHPLRRSLAAKTWLIQAMRCLGKSNAQRPAVFHAGIADSVSIFPRNLPVCNVKYL